MRKLYFLIFILSCSILAAQEIVSESWCMIPKTIGSPLTVAIHPNSNLLASALTDNTIQLYSLEDGKPLSTLIGHEKAIRALAFHPDGKTLASGDLDGVILLWAIPTGKVIFKLAKHTQPIQYLLFHPEGKYLASAGADQKILVWLVENGNLLYQLEGHKDEVTGLMFHSARNLLVSTSRDNTIRIWKLFDKETSPTTLPPTPENLANRAKYYREKGDLANAIIDYKAAIQVDPQNNMLHYELALAYALKAKLSLEGSPAYEEDLAASLQALEKAFKAGFQKWDLLTQESKSLPLIKEPRFQKLLNIYHPPMQSAGIGSKPISFDVVEEKGSLVVPAYEIWINDQKITPQTAFLPNTEYKIEVKFKEFKTVKKRAYLDQTRDYFVLILPLLRLLKYEFFTRENEMILDGIKYPFKFYADKEEIEEHLLECNKKGISYYYTTRIAPEYKELRVEAGYLYAEAPLATLKGGLIRLDKLSIPLLIKHLEALAKKHPQGYLISLVALEQLLQSRYWSSKIKYAPMDDLVELINFIENLRFERDEDRARVRLLMDALLGLIGRKGDD